MLDPHVDEARTKQDLSKVQTIAIDEKSYRRRHRGVTFAMDLDLRRFLHRTVGRDGDTLAVFVVDLKLHGEEAAQIQGCSDLSPAFTKGIREHLPKPKDEITFDRFHLMKLMNEVGRDLWQGLL